VIADGGYSPLTTACLHTATRHKSLAFIVGRSARYVKQNESNKYPHSKGKSDSQYTWFRMGVLEGWLASQLQPFSLAAYLQLFIPRYWSFPQQPIYYTHSKYVGTGRSVTFPMERNLSQFNAFYDLPHYPGYTLIPCPAPATRQRIQSIRYPHTNQDNYNMTIRCSSTKQRISPQSVCICSTRRSEKHRLFPYAKLPGWVCNIHGVFSVE